MTPTPTNQPSDFDRFQSLAKRILTTPKAELVKETPKPRPKPAGNKPK